MVLNRVVKPTNARSIRALEKKEPKIHENDKAAIFIKGGVTSQVVGDVLSDLHKLKAPNGTMYRKKNMTRPFENPSMVEFFTNKSDASLFAFGSHSKKRPHNLVIGRTFDKHLLDMFEFGIVKYTSIKDEKYKHVEKPPVGTKPVIIFSGEQFDVDEEHKRMRNTLLDFYRGAKAEKVRLEGLEHVLQFTLAAGKLYIRSYRVLLKQSGTRIPRVELEEVGPSLDLVLRRTHLASDDLYKRACKQPKTAKPRKKKNVSHDAFGTKLGRIHMTKQDYNKLQTRKMKGLKRKALNVVEDNSSEKVPRTEREEEDMDV